MRDDDRGPLHYLIHISKMGRGGGTSDGVRLEDPLRENFLKWMRLTWEEAQSIFNQQTLILERTSFASLNDAIPLNHVGQQYLIQWIWKSNTFCVHIYVKEVSCSYTHSYNYLLY